jgi:hypothetical protein
MKSTIPKKSKRNLHADPNTSTSNGMRIDHTCSNQWQKEINALMTL